MEQKLQDALNNNLPNGYDDDFADTVIEVTGPDPEGREWEIAPYHTGQRQNPNDWSSPMIVGVEIDLPHIEAKAIYDGFSWSVER